MKWHQEEKKKRKRRIFTYSARKKSAKGHSDISVLNPDLFEADSAKRGEQ